jgi:hypothetical protein
MTRPLFAFALILGLSFAGGSARAGNEPRMVRVSLDAPLSVATLLEAGLDVVSVRGAGEAILLEWPGDEETIERFGARVEVLDDHPGRTAALRARAELAGPPVPSPHRVRSAIRPDGEFRIESLPPFGSGSMAGYWTTSEIKMKLDDLVASDVNDVIADRVDTLGFSWQGRPIWGLELGRSGPGGGSLPAVFLNALTHAREPESMQVLFRFADDLLSKYGVDPFATHLLDHRRIYIVPLVNPDGYAVNEDFYFGSGGSILGLWRKNTRDNNNNHVFDSDKDGVDLDRNYSFRWGKDNTGSSKSPSAENYRGPSPFSEPEARAERDRVVLLEPVTGLSFHTPSDLLYHPWAHTDSLCPDVAAFREWSDAMTRDNAYQSGGGALGLYLANGDFGDWCYGDTLLKPRAFVWTPEVGSDNDGFWPPPSRILPLAQENLRLLYVATAIAGPFVQQDGVEILEGAMNAGRLTNLQVHARNLGAAGSAGPGLTGTIAALDAGAHVLAGTISYPTLASRQSGVSATPFQLALDDTVTPGRLLRFQVDFTAPDGLFSRDTLSIPSGTPGLVAFDDASSGLGKWSPGSWGIVTSDPAHPSRYFSDSPGGSYAANANNVLRMNAPLDLSVGVHAYALYESRWGLEKNYDSASIEASLDGVLWTRLRAAGTTPARGLGTQVPAGEPLYAGVRWLWKPDRADLSAFTGPGRAAVRLRFRLQSNADLQFDGFNFDSLRVVVYDPAAQPAPVAVGDGAAPGAPSLDPPSPNPARGPVRLSFAVPRSGRVLLRIFDAEGRRVRTLNACRLLAGRFVQGWDVRDEEGNRVAPGIYFARMDGVGGGATRRFVVLR